MGKSGSDMKRRRQEAPRPTRDGPAGDGSARAQRRERIARRKQRGMRGAGGSRFASRRPVVRFVLLLAGMMVLFKALFYVFGPLECVRTYLVLNAELTGAVLRVFGEDAAVVGTSVRSPRFSVDIRHGCDALQVSAFFVFAVLAFPASVSRWRRAPALVVGVGLLSAINLLRIVSLYYTGIYFPGVFEAMHIAVWQPVFIMLGLLFWIVWICRVRQPAAGAVCGSP